jgi:hypothetical protein
LKKKPEFQSACVGVFHDSASGKLERDGAGSSLINDLERDGSAWH